MIITNRKSATEKRMNCAQNGTTTAHCEGIVVEYLVNYIYNRKNSELYNRICMPEKQENMYV